MPKKKGVVKKVVDAVVGADENKDEVMVCEPKPKTKKVKKSDNSDLKKFAKFKK